MTDFNKLKNFKGKISSKWIVPDNYRRWIAGSNKLLKLYYRLINSGLLWPDLINELQKVVVAWEEIGVSKYMDKINPQYFTEFAEIKSFDVTRHLAFQKNIRQLLGNDKVETFVEETREHTKTERCHFCNVKLVYPSYILHRFQTEIIHKSEAVGVMCLHHFVGKLQKLIQKDELKQLLEDINKVGQPAVLAGSI